MAYILEKEKQPGYHITEIPKGDYGEISKIKEEVLELEDAAIQGVHLMVLMELSDLYGAMEGYLKKHYKDVTMADIEKMSQVTQRAFRNGHRN